MRRPTKYEKETIILGNEADDFYEVYTYNCSLKKRLSRFSKDYPQCCKIIRSTADGSETYRIDKGRLAFRITAPYSAERKQIASKCGKVYGLATKSIEADVGVT